MDSYLCKKCFRKPVFYRISEDGILEITTGNDLERISLNLCNPIPLQFEKKAAGYQFAFLSAALFFGISACFTGVFFQILQVVFFSLFLLLLLLFLKKRTRYCRFHTFDGKDIQIDSGFGRKTEFGRFIRMLQRRIAQEFQVTETEPLTEERYLRELRELQDSRILTESEAHLLKQRYGNTKIRITPHTFVILDVLRMDGVISEEEFQEMKYDRIFKQQSIRK